MGTLQWAGVAAGTAILGFLGTIWILGRRAVARLQRRRKEQGQHLPSGPGRPAPQPPEPPFRNSGR